MVKTTKVVLEGPREKNTLTGTKCHTHMCPVQKNEHLKLLMQT